MKVSFGPRQHKVLDEYDFVLCKYMDEISICTILDVLRDFEDPTVISIQPLTDFYQPLEDLLDNEERRAGEGELMIRNNPKYCLTDEEKLSSREMWKILLGHRVAQYGEQVVYNDIMKPLLPAERIQFISFKRWLDTSENSVLPRSRRMQKRVIEEYLQIEGLYMSELIKADNEYKEWIAGISTDFRKSQIRASMKINDEMLRFYWKLGKGISSMSEQFGYGMGFYKTVSDDLKSILPDVKSFSPTNLKYMRYFYEMYPDAVICPQVEDELITDANRPQVGDDLQIIFRIPWGHNKIILDKCKGNSAKALFYIRKTIENNWSRDVLLNFLGTDLYERQGKAITNFSNTLPIEQSDLAQAITKDPYNFDFLTLRERYDEKELKDALIEKVNNFLMELGTGFAYMGREVRIEVGDTEKFIDMLFYNTQRHCYVVVEIKTGKFDSSYAGQLGTYVVAVNHQMKTEADNPTLGLLICKDMDKVEAQYALESTSQPLGISSYELSKLIPEEFRGSMPTIEEIEAELNE